LKLDLEKKEDSKLIKFKLNYCDGCDSTVYRWDTVKVTASGRSFCIKCKVPEKEEIIFEGFSRNIFCSKCGKIVSEEQKKTPDINDRVFCSDEHKDEFYKRVETCECCGKEIS